VGTPEGAAFESNKEAGLTAVEARLGEIVPADRVN
jgi:hypothetical protein